MKCNHCGASLRPTAKLCIQCGNSVGSAPEPVAAPAPAVADVPAAPADAEQSQMPAQEASPLVPDTTPAPVLDEPVPPATVQPPVQVPAQAAVQMPEELPVQAPSAAPKIASAPVAQATAKYEVAPEFATPPAAPSPAPAPANANYANSAKQAATTSKSGVKMAVGGLGLLTAGAVAYFALAGGSKAPAPQAAPAPAPAQVVAPAVPAPAAVMARIVDKAFINDMLQLVGQDQWSALAEMVSNAQAQANPNAQALREQAQAALSSRNNAQAQKLTLELLLTDPQSGSAWLLASQVFAAQDITQPAQSALKLAYYFAKDRAQALSSLGDFARAAEPKFKAVANQTSPQLQAIPARKP